MKTHTPLFTIYLLIQKNGKKKKNKGASHIEREFIVEAERGSAASWATSKAVRVSAVAKMRR